MRELLQRIIYIFAEKGKMIGVSRGNLKSFLFPLYRLICKVFYKCFDYLYMYHVEIPVTQKCTLKCKDCSFMMPYFEHPIDYKAEDLLKYMDRLINSVDSIQILRILGGEPFVYKDLDLIISKALSSNKIKTVDIVTNGTLIPSKKIVDIMKNSKLTVQISDYGNISTNKEQLKQLCEKNEIKCVIRSMNDKNWFNAGNLRFRGRTGKEISRQLKKCAGICRSFQNGKLYFCPRASFGTLLGIPDVISDYVDFTVEQDKKIYRDQLYKINQRKGFLACNYCDEGTSDFSVITPAIQIDNVDEIKEWRKSIDKTSIQ